MPGVSERSGEQPITDPIGRGLDQVGAVTEQAVQALGAQVGTELGAVPPAAPDAPAAAVAVRVGAAVPELTEPSQASASHDVSTPLKMAETSIEQAAGAAQPTRPERDRRIPPPSSAVSYPENKPEQGQLSAEAAATVAAVSGLRAVTKTPDGQLIVGAPLFYVPEPHGHQLYIYPADLAGADPATLKGRELTTAAFVAKLQALRTTLPSEEEQRASGLAALMRVQPQLFGPSVLPEPSPSHVEAPLKPPTSPTEQRGAHRESEVVHQAQADIGRRARALVAVAQQVGQTLIQNTVGASTGEEARALLAEIRGPLVTTQREALAVATEHARDTTAVDRETADKIDSLGIHLPTEQIPAERKEMTELVKRMYGLIGELTEPVEQRRAV